MNRSEFEWAEVPYPARLSGTVETFKEDDDHSPHLFLYVPDITMETGWAAHRVPERKSEKAERRPVGFRR